MNAYLIVPLLSCVVSAMVAAALLTRDPGRRANRVAALLVGSASWWAFCEVLWNTSDDPVVVLRFIKLSSIGWCALGPLALHLFLDLAQAPAPRTRRVLPWLYGLGAVVMLLDQFTSFIHDGTVTRHAWGWSYGLSKSYLSFYVYTVVCILMAVRVLWIAFRNSPSRPEREQVALLFVGISIPLTVASATDGVLPLMGVQVPHLGTAAFAVLNGIIAYTFYRYTYPLVAPTSIGREIFENLGDGLALVRPDGRIRTVNAALALLAGCCREDLEEKGVSELLPELGEPLRERRDLECELTAASGRRVPVAVATTVMRERSDQPVAMVLVVRDLREVVGLRNQLVTSGRLAAVGELAAGIAHEINNPIAYAHANLSQLREHWETLGKHLALEDEPELLYLIEEGRDMIEEALEGTNRAAAVVRDVKGFSHAGHGERDLVDLNALLDATLRVASLRYRGRIETLYTVVPMVPASAQELKQVFLNLLLNAAHAIDDNGLIRVATIEVGDDVYVTIQDDGCGMGPDVLERIFDPFFTSKAVGEGTGLGLAICHQIVSRHGGDIHVESEPGRGTIIRVRLPTRLPDEDRP